MFEDGFIYLFIAILKKKGDRGSQCEADNPGVSIQLVVLKLSHLDAELCCGDAVMKGFGEDYTLWISDHW